MILFSIFICAFAQIFFYAKSKQKSVCSSYSQTGNVGHFGAWSCVMAHCYKAQSYQCLVLLYASTLGVQLMKSVCNVILKSLGEKQYNVGSNKRENNIFMVSVLGVVIKKTLYVYGHYKTMNLSNNPREYAVKGQGNAYCQVHVCHMAAVD